MEVALLVEGTLDEVVASQLIRRVGLTKGTVYGKRGWAYIRASAQGFNNASAGTPTLAVVDFMDTGADCPPSVVDEWITNRLDSMLFRVAEPEIESWIIADQTGFANFLNIKRHLVPLRPDELDDAKRPSCD